MTDSIIRFPQRPYLSSTVTNMVPVAGASFSALGVHFDGANDYLTRGAGLTGAADGKVGIVSFWYKMTGGDGALQNIFEAADQAFGVRRETSNAMRILANGCLDITSSTTTHSSSMADWAHFLCSWDLANAFAKMYINGADVSGSPTIINAAIDLTQTGWTIGARSDGTFKIDADMAELYINLAATLDITVQANREKFNLAGVPVDLGSDGSTPTGTAPIVYQSGALATWPTNKGSGGGWTVTGALTASADNPP